MEVIIALSTFNVLALTVLAPLMLPPIPVVIIDAAVTLLVTVKLFDTVKLPEVTILAVFCNAVFAIELATFACTPADKAIPKAELA